MSFVNRSYCLLHGAILDKPLILNHLAASLCSFSLRQFASNCSRNQPCKIWKDTQLWIRCIEYHWISVKYKGSYIRLPICVFIRARAKSRAWNEAMSEKSFEFISEEEMRAGWLDCNVYLSIILIGWFCFTSSNHSRFGWVFQSKESRIQRYEMNIVSIYWYNRDIGKYFFRTITCISYLLRLIV